MSSQEAQNADESEKVLRTKIHEMEEQVAEMKRSLAQTTIGGIDAARNESDEPSEYGYVYILQADLRALCCDYWLSSAGGVLEPSLLHDFPHSATKIQISDIPGDAEMDKIWKMSTYEPWPSEIPKPYTVRVEHSGKTNTSEYISQVGRYLRAAAQDAYESSRQPFKSTFRNSACPLMATPLIGTGWGGNQHNTGEMALQLLPTLYSLAHKLRIDVALVTNDKEVYALMQWARSKMLNNPGGTNRSPYHATISGDRFLLPTHMRRIDDLSQHAIQGNLSLFIGAGASMGSNVPDWGGLVESLADELGLTEERKKEFSKVDVYTKAAVLEAEVERRNKLQEEQGAALASATTTGIVSERKGEDDTVWSTRGEGREEEEKEHKALCLGDYVARRLIHARHSIVHALLASLPVQEAITTNYDDLFEKAWRVHSDFAVLPHAPLRRSSSRGGSSNLSSKWLLKMHGCVTTPEEIVLTKSHYIRYAERYAALAGIVQASLLTRHLLFVGFSFDDDNFQRIYDPVRKAKRRQQQQGKERKTSLQHPIPPRRSSSSGHSKKGEKTNWKIKKWMSFNTSQTRREREEQVLRANTRWGVTGCEDDDSDEEDHCGTALLLRHSVLKEELWEGDICMTSMGPDAPPSPTISTDQHVSSLARKQEIFLDILSSQCAVSLQMEFLMNDKFEKALSPSELQLRDVVRDFEKNLKCLPVESTQNVAFARITDMLQSLGSRSNQYY